MKRILVPTDFSATANNAVKYAAQFCKENKYKMILLNVMHVPVVDMNVAMVLNNMMETQKKEVEGKMEVYGQELQELYGVEVETMAKFGLGADVIVQESNEMDVSFIVMGTHGATGIFDSMMGSVSNAVIKRSDVPVVVLPKDSVYSTIEKVSFAYDYKEEISSELRFVHELNPSKKVKIDIISVEPDKEEGRYEEVVVADKDGVKEVSIWAHSIQDGIKRYSQKENVSLIGLKRHERGFIEDLFHKSTTKELLNNSTIPMIVFN